MKKTKKIIGVVFLVIGGICTFPIIFLGVTTGLLEYMFKLGYNIFKDNQPVIKP